MGLKKYADKRNFKKTPEPGAKTVKPDKSLVFVVQRHHASHLHYDFRLEMEGVLKSWAVPKGPSMNPGDKRLAMMVEDHPFAYRKFAGTIPKGNYGAGEVEIWDSGTYNAASEPGKIAEEKELLKELNAGDLKFILNGKHLKGEFALVKMRNAKQENAWLLIKKHDEYAVNETYTSENYPSLIARKKRVPVKKKTEKKVKPIADEEESPARGVRSSKDRIHVPNYIKPMLARQADAPFDDEEWIFEIKWDGYRAIAETGSNLKLYSRNGISFLDLYPEIADGLRKIKSSLILDGEIVAMDENGIPFFQLLQNYKSDASSIAYYVLDILRKDKKDLTSLPLLERKAILNKVIKRNPVIRVSDHIAGEGIKFFKLAKQKNLEGIMAKRADSTYSPGVRTDDWLKIKNHKNQEAVIAGYTEPRRSRKHFGALVLGMYNNGELKYCGHTGTGFDEKSLEILHEQLSSLKQSSSPFREKVKTNMPVTWVKPSLVCQLKYAEMTKDGIMRHPVFLGLREDLEAKEVKDDRERIVKINGSAPEPVKAVKRKNSKATAVREKEPATSSDYEKIIGKQKVKFTNQNKIYFPKEKITKGEIVAYYQSMDDYILPYLKDRPQSLYRNPNGITAPGFFHKDAGDEAPGWIKTKKIFSESANKDVHYIVCNDKATLAYLNNLGSIELNPWHSRIGSFDKPDYLAIDLDPSEKNTFAQVIEAALAVKEIFDKAGAKSYCKTSGATGIHIYVPLAAKYHYEQVKDFAYIVAIMASELVPDFTTLDRPLKKRGNNIYMDYLQNRRGQTLASVYSARPKPGATVSTPLDWKEVKKDLDPTAFTIKTILARLKKKGDLFKPILGKGIDLKKCLKNLEG